MLPKRVVLLVIALTFLPICLNGIGIRFSALPAVPLSKEEIADLPIAERQVFEQDVTNGAIINVLLQWTAFMIALGTAAFAITHYFVAHDVTTPTISTALFFSGVIDAFQSLAAVNLLPFVVNIDNFLPFMWFVSRLVNVCFLIAGTLPFVWRYQGTASRPRDKDLRFFILAAVLFAVMAYVIVFLCSFHRACRKPFSRMPAWSTGRGTCSRWSCICLPVRSSFRGFIAPNRACSRTRCL